MKLTAGVNARVPRLLLVMMSTACSEPAPVAVLPDAGQVTEWYGEGTQASVEGNILEIRGTIDPVHLERGGRIWARGTPFFYLFNVHVQRLLQEYPDLAGVRVRTFTEAGDEVAWAMMVRSDLNEFRWKEALARASLAQQQGTLRPRLIERLIRFGEEHIDFGYRVLAQ